MPFSWSILVDDSAPGIHDGNPLLAGPLNALAAKVGNDDSDVVTCLDYLLKNAASINPGHKHSELWASDGSSEVVVSNAGGIITINNSLNDLLFKIMNPSGGIQFGLVSGMPYIGLINNNPISWKSGWIKGNPSNADVYLGLDGGIVGIGTDSPVISGSGKLHLASDTLRLDTARTPASSGAAGNAGEICWDSGYIYICVSNNSWKKTAISAW